MSTQIVFLVDVSQKHDLATESVTFANSLCLACFRLLHYAASKIDRSCGKNDHRPSTLKWGYKFFSSSSSVSKVEKHSLRDFKLKYFEEFENEIHRRLQADQASSDKSVKKSKASDCLTKAFTELLYDFHWEKPDITSPVRGKQKKETKQSQANLVFLLSCCPKTASQMKQFTGKRVPDDEVFLDSILPPALLQQFCHVSKLSLFWIDTELLTSVLRGSVDLEVLKIADEALIKCSGKLIPLDTLVQRGNPYMSHVSQILGLAEETEREDNDQEQQRGCLLLPLTSALDHYVTLNTHSYSTVTPETGTVTAKLCIGDRELVELSLVPTVRHTGLNNGLKQSRTKDENTPGHGTEVALSELINSEQNSSVDLFPTSPVYLQVYGVLESGLQDDNLLLGMAYVSMVAKPETSQKTDTDRMENKCKRHQHLLTTLAARKALLVLRCDSSPYLFVMEPLTMATGLVRAVRAGRVLHLEKSLFTHTPTGSDRDTTVWDSKDTLEDSGVDAGRINSLINRLVTSTSTCTSQPQTASLMNDPCGQPRRHGGQFDGKLLDRWHIPGRRSALTSLIDKLNDRIEKLDFLTEAETSSLKQLQKAYKTTLPGLRETPVVSEGRQSLGCSVLEGPLDDSISKPDSVTRASKKSGRASISTRADMIMTKSKEVVKERGQVEKDESKTEKLDKTQVNLPNGIDFKNEEELKEYLTSMYRRVVQGEVTGTESCVQTMVTAVLHYMKQRNTEEPEQKASGLLGDCLVLSGSQLREMYASRTDEAHKQEKITEYQVQVLLQVEMMSTLVNKDQSLGEEEVNDEVVGLLRTLSFISEPGLLSQFMRNCLLYNYMHTIPKTLANIYDELMQPLPDALANIISPDNSLSQSVEEGEVEVGPPSARTRSHGSVGPPSSQPGSNTSGVTAPVTKQRGRKLVHHPSLADFGPKRQIVVDVVKQKKEQTDREKKKVKKAKDKDKVCKSLFHRNGSGRGGVKLERRQSVAVMERTHKTPKKSRSKLLLKSPISTFRSPGRQKLVMETPCHKQVSQALWSRLEKQRRQSDVTATKTDVVEESPEKAAPGIRDKNTPSKGKRAKALLRRSFYSAGPVNRTRNLTKYFQLADRIAGRTRHPSTGGTGLPRLLTADTSADFKSPDKNSSFLMSQFITSPSPAKVTPRKLAMTPSKLLESPSMNTRSKVGPAFMSPKIQELKSPASRRPSPGVLVADSGCKNPDNVVEHTTPTKSPICGMISAGLDSPSQNTRLKMSATPTRRSVRAALFAKSPATSRYQSPQYGRRGSPQTLLHRFNSPGKGGREGFTSPDKQKTFLSPAKVRHLHSAGKGSSASKPAQRLFEDRSQDLALKEKLLQSEDSSMSQGHLYSEEKTGNLGNVHSGNASTVRQTEPMIAMSGQQREENKGAETDMCLRSTPRKTRKALVNSFGREVEGMKTVNENAKLTKSPASSLKSEHCHKEEYYGKGSSVEKAPVVTFQRTPSPKPKSATKTPDSFDKWHRRKPRNHISPAVQAKIQSTVSARGRQSTSDDEVSFKVSDEKVLEKMANEPVFMSPKYKGRQQAEEQASGCEQTYFGDSEQQEKYSVKPFAASLRKKRSLLLSPERASESPSKKRRTCGTLENEVQALSTLSRKESSLSSDMLVGSQGFDVTGSQSELSQRSSISSIDYFSSTNDEVFLSQSSVGEQTSVDVEDKEDRFSFSGTVPGRKCLKEFRNLSSETAAVKVKGIGRFSDEQIVRKMQERSESPIFSHSKLVERRRNISGALDKQNVDGNCSSSKENTASNSPNSMSPGRSGVSPGRKFSPVVSAKSLMHLIQSPLLRSPVGGGAVGQESADAVSPLRRTNQRKPNAGQRSRRSLQLQN